MIIQWSPSEVQSSVPGNSVPRKLGSFSDWVSLKVQVKDASTLWLASDSQTLSNPVQGQQGGFSIVKGDGVKEWWIIGDLYGVVSAQNALVDIQVFRGGMRQSGVRQ
jgi:hypothetical protein